MKLTDLNPKWTDGVDGTRYLDFECPALHKVWDDSEMKCTILLPVTNPGSWQAMGENFNELTITPSIWHHCKKDPHFFITNGEIVFA